MSGLKGFLNIIGLATKDGETPPGDATGTILSIGFKKQGKNAILPC